METNFVGGSRWGGSLLTQSVEVESGWIRGVRIRIFFPICGREVGQSWEAVSEELVRGRIMSVSDGSNVLEAWKAKREGSIRSKDCTYWSSRSVSFAKNADWATADGLSASRMANFSENHLFSRPAADAHLNNTYECAKEEEPRLCFSDCVLMFGPDGYLVEDTDTRTPTPCRFYHFCNFDIIDPEETDDGKEIASVALRKFLAYTWHGGEGAHHAGMMGAALAFFGGEVGRFSIPRIGATPGRLRKIRHSSISLDPTTPAVGVVWAEPCMQIVSAMSRLSGLMGAAYSMASLRSPRNSVLGLYSAMRIIAFLRAKRRNYASRTATSSPTVISEGVCAP